MHLTKSILHTLFSVETGFCMIKYIKLVFEKKKLTDLSIRFPLMNFLQKIPIKMIEN